MNEPRGYEPTRMVGRQRVPATARPVVRNGFEDDFFKEARQMQKQMIKSTPWYFKVWALVCVTFSIAFGLGLLALLFFGIKALAG